MTREWAEAFVSEDVDRACELMTGEAKRSLVAAGTRLGARSCRDVLRAIRGLMDKGELGELADLKIESVRIRGSTAEVVSNADERGEDPTRLRKVEGEWLLDDDADG